MTKAMSKITVGILKPGSAPADLAASQGDYDAAFRRLLADDDFDFVTYDVENGVLPASPTSADAWLITGSRHGVYEDHAWIEPLENFIWQVRDEGVPLVGVCFGHQIIAQALGGRVERASTGWIAGPQTYCGVDGSNFVLNAWHRDQVVQVPPDAEVVAVGQECALAALRYRGSPILTFQAHPEFDRAYLEGLLRERGDALGQTMRNEVTERITTMDLQQSYVAAGIKEVLRRRR